MLSNSQLYHTWRVQLHQLAPDECESRVTNMLWLVVGLFLAHSVHLTLIARKLPVRAKKLSLDKRLRRFLSNRTVRVRTWYHPVAGWLVQAASVAGQVHLVIDASKVSAKHRLVIVGIAYRGRALPLAWTWVRSACGHSTTRKQVALLGYVQGLLPPGVRVSLVGDCEFGRPLLLEYLDGWGWNYALRQPGDHLVMTKGDPDWKRLDRFGVQPGTLIWIGRALLTRASAYPTNLLLFWRPGEREPWYLATNLVEPRAILRLYRRRMWIEALFGDLKGHGFDLEASRLRHFLRLSRLTLAVCLVYVWLVAIGAHVLQSGQTHEVDRTDRRDLSVFRLGWDFIERRLALHDPFPTLLVPNFCSVSGD